jgi:hypothetical protein
LRWQYPRGPGIDVGQEQAYDRSPNRRDKGNPQHDPLVFRENDQQIEQTDLIVFGARCVFRSIDNSFIGHIPRFNLCDNLFARYRL